MICSKCNSKWESQNNTDKCPFCGADIPKSKEVESISDAIEKIVSERGIDILHNPKLIYSLITDYVTGYHKEKKLLNILITNNAFEKISELLSITDEQEKTIQVQKLIAFLENDLFISKDNAELILDIIFRGLDIHYTFQKEKNAPATNNDIPRYSVTQNDSLIQMTDGEIDDLVERAKNLYKGEGVLADKKEALRLFSIAAVQGSAPAQNFLGTYYDKGDGVEKNITQALKWYRLAAEQGDPQAQCNLGITYDTGEGVSKNPIEAIKWYRLAAEQGMSDAQYNLGVHYEQGVGVPGNLTEAIKWYRLAAEQGMPEAQYNLGVAYDVGNGVPQDPIEAIKWYRLAAEQGMSDAQYNLGVHYEQGMGVPKDLTEAIKWYRLSANQGNVRSKNALAELGQSQKLVNVNNSNAAITDNSKNDAVTAKRSKKLSPYNGKDKFILTVICFLLGGFGIHNFIMGETKKGIVKIVLSCFCGISGFLALYDLFRLIAGTYKVDKEAYL